MCDPNGLLSFLCDPIDGFLGALAYNSLVQGILFQAGYLRIPTMVNSTAYLQNSQIAQWNNEYIVNATFKSNFGLTKKFAMIKALQDQMVFPNEGASMPVALCSEFIPPSI